MTTFNLEGIVVDSVTETNDEITVVLAPQHGAFPAGVLDSNFEAFTGFTVNEDGTITPVFEPVTLTFNGY